MQSSHASNCQSVMHHDQEQVQQDFDSLDFPSSIDRGYQFFSHDRGTSSSFSLRRARSLRQHSDPHIIVPPDDNETEPNQQLPIHRTYSSEIPASGDLSSENLDAEFAALAISQSDSSEPINLPQLIERCEGDVELHAEVLAHPCV